MTLSRRSMLKAGLTAGVTAFATPLDSVAFGEPIRTRYSASSVKGQAMLAKYATAVGLMMDGTKYPRSDPRSWSFQWYTHWIPGPSTFPGAQTTKQQMISQLFMGKPATDPGRQLAEAMWDNCQAHSSNPSDPNFFQEMYFCNWHRHYVYYFEEIIRGVLNDPTFTLPYWNYLSGNVSDLSIPPPFRDTSSPLYRPNRNPWVNTGERVDKQNPGSLSLDALQEPQYIDSADGGEGFCPILDGNPHGLMHVLIGNQTNMGNVPNAANDPIFWVHHCNIDRLWESWNRVAGHANPTWPNRSFPFANGQGQAVSVAAAKANRPSLLNYQYDAYATVSGGAPPLHLGITGAAPKVTRAFATAPLTLGSERGGVSLSPAGPSSAAPPSAERVFGLSSASRRLYLVLGDIAAPADAASTYNVFLDLPSGVTNPGTTDPHYVGTLHFFGAAGHEQHGPSSHRIVMNITNKVRRLLANRALTATPTVTLIRHGDAESEKPTVGQVLLVEA
jgi:tyrosinase